MTQEIKVGDIVHVRATVQCLRGSNYKGGVVGLRIDGGEVECYGDTIVHVEPRPLQVGDVVKDPAGLCGKGSIVHIIADRDKAWVIYSDTRSGVIECVETLSQLRRA